jgi:hypothetical protein
VSSGITVRAGARRRGDDTVSEVLRDPRCSGLAELEGSVGARWLVKEPKVSEVFRDPRCHRIWSGRMVSMLGLDASSSLEFEYA